MLTTEKLVELQGKSNTSIETMEGAVEKLNALITRHEADKSRSQSYTLESVKAERDKVIPALAAELKIIRELAQEAGAQQRFWESRSLLMSLQAFSDDPAKDAAIRVAQASELENMPAPLLQLAYENARFDNNLPLLWQFFRTGQKQSVGNAGFAASVDMTLEGLTIPGQAASLAAISECVTNVNHAEHIAVVAAGMRSDPIRKLTVARQQEVTSNLVQAAAVVANAQAA